MSYIVKHRDLGACFGGVLADEYGFWTLALSKAHRFPSIEDALMTTLVTCPTVRKDDLVVIPIIEQTIGVPA